MGTYKRGPVFREESLRDKDTGGSSRKIQGGQRVDRGRLVKESLRRRLETHPFILTLPFGNIFLTMTVTVSN